MTKIDIYDISPQKFEELAFSFLQEQSDLGSLENLTSGKINSGYDFSAVLNHSNKSFKIAIEAKHRRKLTKQDLHKIAESAARIKGNFDGFILVTSAELTHEEQNLLTSLIQRSGYVFVKIYQSITFESLTAASNPQAVNEIIESKKTERTNFVYGFSSLVAGLVGLVFSVLSYLPYFQAEENSLDTRIENVASALESIKSLEKHLTEIKLDMQKTQRESEAIQKEYEKSQTLKQLTNEQLIAIRSAIETSSPPWWAKPLDYIFGFILGIGASVIASIIQEKIKRNRALNSPA